MITVERHSKKYNPIWKRKALDGAARIVEGAAIQRVPVDTGRLRGSIKREIGDDEATVGTGVEYAQHVEYGTRHMRAQSYLRPAIDTNKSNIKRFFTDMFRRWAFRG